MNHLTVMIISISIIVVSVILLFFWFKYLEIKTASRKKVIIIYSIALVILLIAISAIAYYFEPPKLKLIGNTEMNISLNSNYQDEGIKSSWHKKDLSKNVKIINNVDNTKVGTYEIIYEVKHNKKTYNVKRKINIIDDIKPTINFEGEKDITVCPNVNYLDLPYTVTDNYDTDIKDKVIITKTLIDDFNYTLEYKVSDSSGNEEILTRNIKVSDDTKPVIKLVGKSSMNLMKGHSYKEAGYVANDNCDGDITKNVKISGSVDANTEATYTLTYKVTDSKGNTASTQRKITIINPDITKNTIYLTFDDGPSTNITKQILDILKEENVKATFFLVDFGSNKNYLVQRMVSEGHSIGIHGKSHVYKEIYKSVDAYMYNIDYMNEKIKNLTGIDSRITRFPGGSSNTVSSFNKGIMTTLTREVVARGYLYYDWNISSGDAGGTTSSTGVYNNVISGLKYNRANVVLMHDLNNKTYTANALRDIIKYGKENGYSFKNITENTPMVTMRVNN